MRLAIFICVVFLAASCTQRSDSGVGSSDTASSGTTSVDSVRVIVPEPDEPIASVEAIQEAYSGVMDRWKSGGLDSVSFEYSCRNGETSGSVTYFSQDGDLQLMVHRYNEYSHYSAEDHYFVRDSMLYFAFLKGVSWSFDDGPEGATRDNITEQRIYLLDQQPVQCLEKKYVIRSHSGDNPRPETVANNQVDCTSASSLLAVYRRLLQHHGNPPPSGCFEGS